MVTRSRRERKVAHDLACHGGERGVPAFSEALHQILRGKTKENEGWREALRNSRRWELCAAQCRLSPSRGPSCVWGQKGDETARIVTFMVGTLKVSNRICEKLEGTERRQDRSCSPH